MTTVIAMAIDEFKILLIFCISRSSTVVVVIFCRCYILIRVYFFILRLFRRGRGPCLFMHKYKCPDLK